jgi:transducin (beta)-like 1
VVALSFTPDGAFLASATSRQILIWRMEDVSTPRARWNLDSERDLGDDTMNAPDDEQERNLSWDASGHKLAYGINNSVCLPAAAAKLLLANLQQIAVIEWRPMANGVVH